jgi:hypothetical protein
MLAFGPLWSPNAPLKNLLLNDWPFSQKPSAINEPLIEGVVNCYISALHHPDFEVLICLSYLHPTPHQFVNSTYQCELKLKSLHINAPIPRTPANAPRQCDHQVLPSHAAQALPTGVRLFLGGSGLRV